MYHLHTHIADSAKYVLIAALGLLFFSAWIFFFSSYEDNKLLGTYISAWAIAMMIGYRVIETNQEFDFHVPDELKPSVKLSTAPSEAQSFNVKEVESVVETDEKSSVVVEEKQPEWTDGGVNNVVEKVEEEQPIENPTAVATAVVDDVKKPPTNPPKKRRYKKKSKIHTT